MRVLISGSGYVGCALGGRLAREGFEVFGLRRNPRGMPPGVRPVAADFTDAESLVRALPEGLDYVFHTASPGISGASTAEDREAAYRGAYVRGPSNLISALRSRGERPRRMLLTSSTGVYAQGNGEWVDEISLAEPNGTGRFMLEGEKTVLDGPFPAVALRLAGIYGPGRTGALELASRYQARRDTGEPPAYTNRIHRDDCAGALRHLMLLECPAPLYVGADHEPATPEQMASWLAREYPAVREEEASGIASVTRSRGRTNKRCSNARLVGSGYAFEYPTFREGFTSLLER